jgi:lipopolysaccharide export system protein LptA
MTHGVLAQGANLTLGSGTFDSGMPVEVSADTFSVDQNSGQAVFDGNVLVVQGDVRMSADKVLIEYATDGDATANGISRLIASGGVTFVTPTDAAEAREAVYSIADSTVTLSGDVLLTQGQNALSGERLIVDLTSGTGRMEGRVRTVFGAGNN